MATDEEETESIDLSALDPIYLSYPFLTSVLVHPAAGQAFQDSKLPPDLNCALLMNFVLGTPYGRLTSTGLAPAKGSSRVSLGPEAPSPEEQGFEMTNVSIQTIRKKFSEWRRLFLDPRLRERIYGEIISKSNFAVRYEEEFYSFISVVESMMPGVSDDDESRERKTSEAVRLKDCLFNCQRSPTIKSYKKKYAPFTVLDLYVAMWRMQIDYVSGEKSELLEEWRSQRIGIIMEKMSDFSSRIRRKIDCSRCFDKRIRSIPPIFLPSIMKYLSDFRISDPGEFKVLFFSSFLHCICLASIWTVAIRVDYYMSRLIALTDEQQEAVGKAVYEADRDHDRIANAVVGAMIDHMAGIRPPGR